MSDSSKPVHVQVLYNGPEDWRSVVYGRGVMTAQGRGRTEAHAVEAGVRDYRAWLRLERDERARLALSLAPKLTALTVKAGAL